MTRPFNPSYPLGGVVTDNLPIDTSSPIDKTQWPDEPCDPAAIHDLYPPVGTDFPIKQVCVT